MRPAHLHSLIYRRVVKHYGVSKRAEVLMRRNATSSVYLWFVAIACAIPAVMWWQDTSTLVACCAVYVGLYGTLYRRLVRFKVPRILVASAARTRNA